MDVLRPQDPARIGAYTILARLGAGGMGQVYLGRSPGGRLVAVKVIRDEISDHPEALARFRREAATVETVRNAYTAQLIEASLGASPYWLATEYVPGPTLRGAVGTGGPFPPDSALRLFAALAEGLAAVHVHGVTHRDLKPQNVILAPQGPQLIDFGIARGLEQTILTRDGMALGTPGYAAPEVVLRNEAGPAADIFALGATIAYTATGRPPYGTGDATAVSYRAVHEDIDVAGVRPDLASLIRRCVAKDPTQRPGPDAVIAGCAVDSALATDAHYRSLTRDIEPLPVPGPGPLGPPPPSSDGLAPSEPEPEPETEAVTRPVDRGQADRRSAERIPERVPERAAAAGPRVPPGTTPYDGPELRRCTARTARRRTWLAACAVALAVPAVIWLLPEREDKEPPTAAPATDATASRPPTGSNRPSGRATGSGGPAGRTPDHILNDRVSQDRWTLSDDPGQASQGIGSCDLASYAGASPPMALQSSVSHTTGSDTASVELRPKNAGEGRRPAPYYVSVGVRPPHETDRSSGRPLRSVSKGIGFTSKPVDIYSRWSSGGTIRLKYPDDFRAHFGERTVDAIPVGDDRGDWTVVLYHVEGGPTAYTSVVCNGFHA
ncbi:serine/threonine-protein kinase [Streptomyces sp. NPDC048155]|uniref:serine/threonine-protein kinase n=1 Tax=Streptomyces sp. NPDC048155 TaxID=3154818 RepID=UPI0033D9CB81